MKSESKRIQAELNKVKKNIRATLEAAKTPSVLESLESTYLSDNGVLSKVAKEIERMSEVSRPYADRIVKEMHESLTQASKVGAELSKVEEDVRATLEAAKTPSVLESLESTYLSDNGVLSKVAKEIERMSEVSRPYADRIVKEMHESLTQASKVGAELSKVEEDVRATLEAAKTPSVLESLESTYLSDNGVLSKVAKEIERMSEVSRPHADRIVKEMHESLTQASKVGAELSKVEEDVRATLEAAKTPSVLESLESTYLSDNGVLSKVAKEIERMSEVSRLHADRIVKEMHESLTQASKVHKEFEDIRASLHDTLKTIETSGALEALKVDYFGRKGILTNAMKSMGELAKENRPSAGKRANYVRTALTEELKRKEEVLQSREQEQKLPAESVDITLPGRKPAYGKAHPVMQILERIEAIFCQMGFEVVTGPDVETEYYNFDALNTPVDHPARDLHDTFYLTDGHLLRTHTSPVQIRAMENQKPPVRIIVPGKCYRVDYDVSHTPMFHQVEGLLVDKHATFSELKGILTSFARQMFGDQTQMRFRPHFFPFTEPSAEVDISCTVCQGNGCRSCGNTGWIEILGAGAVDPAVFEAVNYDPDEVTGFAFGMGVERIANLQFRIPDIRTFYENDLRFLRQF